MDSPRFLTVPGLGVRHGFSVRTGGVSEGPYASLNCGRAVGDEPGAVTENLARLAQDAGVTGFFQVSQVHGARVCDADGEVDPAALSQEEADALVSSVPGRALAVRTADCVPLLFASPDGRWVAAVHAGWKGTLARVAAAAVSQLEARGVPPAALHLAVGPSIRACCYEVSQELADRFTRELGGSCVAARAGARPHLDLVAANRAVLTAAGVRPESVEVLDACTACEPERFFSHRRDGPRTGRMLSFVVPGKGASFP